MTAVKEKWLYLDDLVGEREKMALAVADSNPDVVLLQAGTMAEAKDVLAKHDVAVFLSDFFLKNGTNAERFIAELRNTWRNLPIVVVSNRTADDSPVFRAGADAVIPKTHDLTAFSKFVSTAVIQAKNIRAMESSSFNTGSVYIAQQIAEDFQFVIRRPRGNIIISAGPGMGRSSTAQAIAQLLCRQHPSRFSTDVKFYRLGNKERDQQEIDADLFGSSSANSPSPKGLLEKHSGSILIIDDAHLLPASCQLRLKALWEDHSAIMNNGAKVRANQMFLILTALDERFSDGAYSFERGFLQTTMTHQIKLPSMIELQPEYTALVNFLVERAAIRRGVSDVRASDDFIGKARELLLHSPLRVTMRSLVNTIEHALEQALQKRRTLLTPSDLENAPFLYERTRSGAATTRDSDFNSAQASNQFAFVKESEAVSVEQWRELHHAAQNCSLAEATALLRQMMVSYASVRFNGNKVKICDALRVGRATLYRPSMREYSASQANDVSIESQP
jgi:DNA-binding NtrC family response regulator